MSLSMWGIKFITASRVETGNGAYPSVCCGGSGGANTGTVGYPNLPETGKESTHDKTN